MFYLSFIKDETNETHDITNLLAQSRSGACKLANLHYICPWNIQVAGLQTVRKGTCLLHISVGKARKPSAVLEQTQIRPKADTF